MRTQLLISVIFAAIFLFANSSAARAQSREDWRATEEGAHTNPNAPLQQSYHGVTPGSGNNLPRVEALKGKPGTWVTWPGFLMRSDGGSRIFIQTTGSVSYRIKRKKNQVILILKKAKVHLSNNRNPLVTTHFNTPLKRAYIKRSRKGLDLVMNLKVKASPQISQTTDPDGYHYLFVDFSPGDYPKIEDVEGRPNFSGYDTLGVSDETEK